MSWNGSGSITWPYDWTDERDKGGNDAIISASKFDEQWNDAKSTIEATLNRNGENSPAANINWGGYKITNLAAGAAVNDAIRARQVAENTVQYGGSTTGSSGTYALTQSFISSIATGTRLLCKANHSNTGAATLNVNSGGAVAIVLADGSTALTGGEIVSGDFFEVAYDGTSWVLINSPSVANGLFPDGTVSIGVDDSVPAILTMYGGGAGEQSAEIRLHNNADDDGTVQYWNIEPVDGSGAFGIARDGGTADLTISTSGAVDVVGAFTAGTIASDGALSGTTLVATGAVTLSNGSVAVGANDTTPGKITLYGGANTEDGGAIDIYNAADHDTNTEFFNIGPNANGDLKIGRGSNDDFVIQENGGGVLISQVSGVAVVGLKDTTPGILEVAGGEAAESGARVRWYQAADDDATAAGEFFEAVVEAGTWSLVREDQTSALQVNADCTLTFAQYANNILGVADGGAVVNIFASINDVTGSRAANTTYQNTTGKPIMVCICASSNATREVEISSDNFSSVIAVVGRVPSNSVSESVSFLVPDDWYYRIDGAATVSSWTEYS